MQSAAEGERIPADHARNMLVKPKVDQDREQKRKIVWVARGSLYWPSEVQEDAIGTAICYKYLGPKTSRGSAVGQSVALPFAENLDRFSKQSSAPDFVRAVLEAVHLSQTGEELDDNDQPALNVRQQIKTAAASDDESGSFTSEYNEPDVVDADITVGTRIRIREAFSIHPKLQPYENTEATVVRSPTHPNSWFTVRLNDGSSVKIRRDSFDVVALAERDSAMQQQAEDLKPSQRPSLYRRNVPRDSKLKRKSVDPPFQSPGKKRKHQSKSRGTKSNLVGKYVIIECGRYKGETGYVVRGGNGYYCVQLGGKKSGGASGGNVMKRSSDLRMIPFPAENEAGRSGMQIPSSRPYRDASSSGHCKNESWVNRKVYVKAGKHQGKMGVVRRSGHGFYCVSIKSVGDVMKRASDLQLCSEQSKPQQQHQQHQQHARRMVENDNVLKHAAFILLDMMKVPSDSEEPSSDDKPQQLLDGLNITNLLSKHLKYYDSLPDNELKTPILRASDLQNDVMSWDQRTVKVKQTWKNNHNRGIMLPQAGSSRVVNHSLSNYW